MLMCIIHIYHVPQELMLCSSLKSKHSGIDRTAQWIKALAAEPDGSSCFPGIRMMERQTSSCKLFLDLHIHVMECVPKQ